MAGAGGRNSNISSAELADLSVTTPKLAALAVTLAKIAANAINDSKVVAGAAIAQSKIANLVSDLAAKAASVHTHLEADITDLQNYALSGHTHLASNISNLAAEILARSKHTGTQLASTISDFVTQVVATKLDDFTAPDDNTDLDAIITKHGLMPKADKVKLDAIEASATADQTDTEIESAYNTQVAIVSQADAEAGTSTTRKGWTAQRVKQAIAALGGGAKALFGGGWNNVNWAAGVNKFFNLWETVNDSNTESMNEVSLGTGFTWKRLHMRMKTNGITAESTLKSRKNAANGNQVLTIASSTTGDFTDTTNTDTIAALDQAGINMIVGGSGSGFGPDGFNSEYDM